MSTHTQQAIPRAHPDNRQPFGLTAMLVGLGLLCAALVDAGRAPMPAGVAPAPAHAALATARTLGADNRQPPRGLVARAERRALAGRGLDPDVLTTAGATNAASPPGSFGIGTGEGAPERRRASRDVRVDLQWLALLARGEPTPSNTDSG